MILPKVIETIIYDYMWSIHHPTAEIIKDAQKNLIMPLSWTPGCEFSFYSTLMDFHTKHIPHIYFMG